MTDNSPKQAKALGLFSGGLDSILACLVLRRANVHVEAITFTSPFFDAFAAKKSAKLYDIPLTVLDVSQEHIDTVVKNPKHGYGSHMNPCIDCHAFMIAKAGEIMDQKGFDFIFTGEVAGQRPMSQNKNSLALVAKLSERKDQILRPLSAKILPITPMEENGLVDRELLLDISGRGRKVQMKLAQELGVTDYPAPAGGCLLTEERFSARLKDIWEQYPEAGANIIHTLKHGRHLRISPKAKLVVGRNQAENKALEALSDTKAVKMHALDTPGPLGLYWGTMEGPDFELALGILAGYGKYNEGEKIRIWIENHPSIIVEPIHRRKAQEMLL